MGRKPGFTLSDEQKQKMQEGRKGKKKTEKPHRTKVDTLIISGNEKNAFDFWPIIRDTLRPEKNYFLCRNICMKITSIEIWDNPSKIKEILSEYFRITKGVIPTNNKPEKRAYSITEEERQRRSERAKNRHAQ